jgi:hypothetical protein
MFQLGRLNFKKEYKNMKLIYPDIDKYSKLSHFKIHWKRHFTNVENTHSAIKLFPEEKCNKRTSEKGDAYSQAEQFFSVVDSLP